MTIRIITARKTVFEATVGQIDGVGRIDPQSTPSRRRGIRRKYDHRILSTGRMEISVDNELVVPLEIHLDPGLDAQGLACRHRHISRYTIGGIYGAPGA